MHRKPQKPAQISHFWEAELFRTHPLLRKEAVKVQEEVYHVGDVVLVQTDDVPEKQLGRIRAFFAREGGQSQWWCEVSWFWIANSYRLQCNINPAHFGNEAIEDLIIRNDVPCSFLQRKAELIYCTSIPNRSDIGFRVNYSRPFYCWRKTVHKVKYLCIFNVHN